MNKIDSKNRLIVLEPWNCALQGLTRLDFDGILQWRREICFIVSNSEASYSISISARSPFQIIDECYATEISQHFPPLGDGGPPTCAWKVRNSPLLRSVEKTVLFLNVPIEQHFSYLVVTNDEHFEFISAEPRIIRLDRTAEQEFIDRITKE